MMILRSFKRAAVIDEQSVLDTGIFNSVTNNEFLLQKKQINGELKIDRTILAKNIKKINDDKKSPYSKYYNYGVGSMTTRENAAASLFKRVLDNDHKSYENVDKKTGENKLQEIYSKL
ncbi:hypothetical protein [Hungatella hathewayi]|uniref:hypothetical protein n=1 Tax=Hungatella hathewayi TaxID=154046 RepID=UPI0035645BAF